jgi:hypothetical protein
MLVELGLGGRNGSGEIVVVQGRIYDDMAVPGEGGRFDAAWDRMPSL